MSADAIFINYRSADDDRFAVRAFYDYLTAYMPVRVFFGVARGDSRVEGGDWIDKALAECSLMIVFIGPHWLDADEHSGKRRIDDPKDYVRCEIVAALTRKLPVLVVLLEGTSLPSADDLPSELKTLPDQEIVTMGHRRNSGWGHSEPFGKIKAMLAGGPIRSPRPLGQKIFISYRRSDTIQIAGRIHERLAKDFSDQDIFFDVDTIPIGANFKAYIRTCLQETAILLCVIGGQWTNKRWGRRWWFINLGVAEEDYVQAEIEIALELAVPILPILVHGSVMPSRHALPASIARICDLNAASVRPGRDFHKDMDAISTLVGGVRQQAPKR